ncbi:MAG TPA: tyrosine-type recombinase/integrase [Pyrinomonadaceae bacterium]|nr:tyrosine-type recombinase/integrase [Pyrinomonadaceae bacterium]
MAGQIIKRGDKTWVVRIFTGRDTNGKRSYLNKTIKGNKKDAETYLSKTLTAMSTGTFVESSPLTVDEYLDRWLQTAAKPRLRAHTFVHYAELLTRYVRPAIGKKRLSDIRPLDIQALYSHMTAPKLKKEDEPQPSITYGLGLSARSVRYTHAVLSSALKQAVKWLMLSQNPAASVDLPRASRKEMKAMTADEAGRFLTAASEDRLSALFSLAITTGMRPEEYLALQWKDIDLEKGIATVQRALVWNRKGGGWTFTAPKTARSRRSIPMPVSVVRALISHKRRQAEARLKAGADYQNYDLVFATREGTPIMPRNLLSRHFKPALRRAKLPDSIRLYDLRHTCATLLLSANEHPKIVSERLGHASITLTLDTYSHVMPSMQQAVSEKLEKMLFSK